MLSAEEEDLDEDIEDIETRNMDELLRGVCLIGRSLALWNSVEHVRSCLESALVEFEGILNQTVDSKAPADKWYLREGSRLLEIQRVCSMFLMHLCFEGAGLESSGGAVSSEELGTSGSSTVSERTVLPKYISSSLGEALLMSRSNGTNRLRDVLVAFQSQMASTVTACARSLDLQRQALQAGAAQKSNLALMEKFESLQSPIVMQAWFEFFKEYVRTYLGADESLYHVADVAIYARRACGACSTSDPTIG